MNYKMVIAVRVDVPMSVGKTAAQVAHAAVELVLKNYSKNKKVLDNWIYEGQKKVVVKVNNLDELYLISKKAEELNVPYSIITDRGLTEIEPGTITCIGIGPDEEKILDKITGSLKLL